MGRRGGAGIAAAPQINYDDPEAAADALLAEADARLQRAQNDPTSQAASRDAKKLLNKDVMNSDDEGDNPTNMRDLEADIRRIEAKMAKDAARRDEEEKAKGENVPQMNELAQRLLAGETMQDIRKDALDKGDMKKVKMLTNED